MEGPNHASVWSKYSRSRSVDYIQHGVVTRLVVINSWGGAGLSVNYTEKITAKSLHGVRVVSLVNFSDWSPSSF